MSANYKLLLLLGLILINIFTNCDHVQLSLEPNLALEEVSTSLTPVCTAPPIAKTNTQSKIIFLVDMSGSNFNGNDGRGDGTDPDKSFRFGSIANFVANNSDNDQISYSLITFQNTTAQALVNVGGDVTQPAFTTDLKQFAMAMNVFAIGLDQGATPYQAAFTMAKQLIAADVLTNPNAATTHYAIALISDGAPTDYGDPVSTPAVLSDVEGIQGLAPNVTWATVYYGPEQNALDAAAAALLKKIASSTNGFFLDTNVSGRNVPLDSIVILNQMIANVVKQFMVINLTSAPCDDGTMGADSDADGLCDQDEVAYNSLIAADPVQGPRMNGYNFDPTNRNSFANSYSDYVNLLAFRYGSSLDLDCTSFNATAHDLLTDCEKATITSSTPEGPTAAWTKLMGTTADPGNYDSDGDGFLDGIELLFGRSKDSVLNYDSGSNMISGYSMQQILLQHRNPLNPAIATPYDPNFIFAGANSQGQNCYNYTQTSLPLYHTLAVPAINTPGFPQLAHEAGENIILVYYIETPEDRVNGPGTLHYMYQKISYGSQVNLNLNPINFQVYVPSTSYVDSVSN